MESVPDLLPACVCFQGGGSCPPTSPSLTRDCGFCPHLPYLPRLPPLEEKPGLPSDSFLCLRTPPSVLWTPGLLRCSFKSLLSKMARDGLSPPSTRAAYDLIESSGGQESLPQGSCSRALPLASLLHPQSWPTTDLCLVGK